ncbi:MAG: pyridoxal-phosphate dependent enzyme [bacterium]
MHYQYKCTKCYKKYNSNYIEENNIYLCPDCGALHKNAPLEGVLSVEYDYPDILKKYGKEKITDLLSGEFYSVPELFPLEFERNDLEITFPGILPEQQKRVQLSSFFSEINYKGIDLKLIDDTRNPTFSYKDRASVLVAFKALQLKKKSVICASTGNAGSSIAGICSRLGLKSIIFVPEKIPTPKKLQIEMYGAELIKVAGDYDLAFDLSLEVSNSLNLYNRNTAYNPLTIEGKKTSAFDIYREYKNRLPDYIIVPAGDGVILGGLYTGFLNLINLGLIEKLPKFIAAQPANGCAIVDYFEKGIFEYKSSETIADSLSAGAPRNLFMANEALKKSDGFGVRIDDDDTLKFQRDLSSKYGFLVEPAASITFACVDHLIESGLISAKDNVLLMLTGNGLKDTKSFEKFANIDKVFDKDAIFKHFGINT